MWSSKNRGVKKDFSFLNVRKERFENQFIVYKKTLRVKYSYVREVSEYVGTKAFFGPRNKIQLY